MKVLKGFIPALLVFSVIGYVVHIQFFGIDAQYEKVADVLIENMEEGEMTYKYVYKNSTGGFNAYAFDENNIHVIYNGEVSDSYPIGSAEYEDNYETIFGYAESASHITELTKDIEIVDGLDFEILGATEEDLSGEWYKVSYKGGCQSGSCKRRGISNDEVTTVYLKVDGTGYVGDVGRGIFFSK